jgi:hypothetical protein
MRVDAAFLKTLKMLRRIWETVYNCGAEGNMILQKYNESITSERVTYPEDIWRLVNR